MADSWGLTMRSTERVNDKVPAGCLIVRVGQRGR
jgi:hypothetical protein